MGLIQKTRYYATGRTLWGAITARLTRSRAGGADQSDYDKMGDFVKKNIITGYFFPGDDENIYIPQYTENGLRFGQGERKLSANQFESRFINSRVQTSIFRGTRTADDESLHEMEYLADRIVVDRIKSVTLTGHLWIKHRCALYEKTIDVNFIQEFLSTVTIGGDLSYGFGVLELILCEPTDSVFGYKLNTQRDRPAIIFNKDEYVVAHVQNKTVKIAGDRECFLFRSHKAYDPIKTDHHGFGQTLDSRQLCWLPGTRVLEDAVMKIGEYGVGILEPRQGN